ncbi:hypothetical protein [Methylomonas methanica]|uniref:hypothetical protein n=1 Tax=Methylomonas methanica TaxID=421 RepID=UPI0012F6C259|nr:hypothetical protein [Methylomonas methanica]
MSLKPMSFLTILTYAPQLTHTPFQVGNPRDRYDSHTGSLRNSVISRIPEQKQAKSHALVVRFCMYSHPGSTNILNLIKCNELILFDYFRNAWHTHQRPTTSEQFLLNVKLAGKKAATVVQSTLAKAYCG